MIKWIFEHQRKSALRAPSYGNNTVINVVLIILLVIMLLYMLAIGFVVDVMIIDFFPEANVIDVFNGFILYYFAMDLFMRFYLQDVPAMEVSHYLLLPIKKSKIIHFMLTKSLLTFFNLMPVFLTLPFAFKQVAPAHGTSGMITWFAAIYLIALCNSFITVYLKKQLSDKPLIPVIFGLVILVVSGLNYLEIFTLNELSSRVFSTIMNTPISIFLLLLALIGTYVFDFNFLKNRLHLESSGTSRAQKVHSGEQLLFLNKYGKIGELIALEIKLILRNKRPKSVLILSAFFLLYGLFFYVSETNLEKMGFLVFIGMFVSGSLMLNYGQFSFSWESSYFDFLLTKRINLEEYIKAKYYLFATTTAISFLLTIPYAYFGWKIVLINLACTIFNIGFNSLAILYFTGKKPKRIDLSKSSVFNYEGTGAAQFIIIIPVLVIPALLYWVTSLVTTPWMGIVVIAMVGGISILFRNKIIKAFIKRFIKNKYTIASSLRAD